MLLRLAYLGLTNTCALLRLIPMSNRDKDIEILALRHQIAVLQRQLGDTRVRFSPAEETVTLIEKDGGRAFSVQARLGVPGDVDKLFSGVERGLRERAGSTKLDILVNNAAEISPTGDAPDDVTPEQFDRFFAVNVKAPFFLVQRALPLLPEGGRIVNVSSGLTRVVNPNQTVYSMTKGAIEQLSRNFARYLAPRGITVNTVAPGNTDNGNPVFKIPEVVEQLAQMSAFKRVGQPGDIADVS